MKNLLVILLLIRAVAAFPQQAEYSKAVETQQIGGRVFYLHPVSKGQTLYAIAKLYVVTLDSLYFFNPEVKEGVKAGQVLKIPQEIKLAVPPPEPMLQRTDTDTAGVPLPSRVSCMQGFYPGPVNVALMLPLYLKEMDSIPHDASWEYDPNREFKSLRFIQFYEGFMLAVDSLVSLGLSVNLHVFDLGEDTLKTKKLLKDPALQKMDLIVGLLYGPSFQQVAMFCKKNKIPLINPLSNKKNHIEDNPYVILVNPTVNTMAEQIAFFLTRRYSECVIVMLNSGKASEIRSMDLIHSELVKAFVAEGRDTLNIFRFSGEKDIQKIPSLIAGKSKNVVVVLTNDELYVANVMRHLKNWTSHSSLLVFGMPGWLDFKSIESSILVDLNFHSFSTSFTDYSRPNIKTFVEEFRHSFKMEPQELVFQGFDVAYYFLSAYMYYGKQLLPCLDSYHIDGLQSRFFLKASDGNGYENHWLNIYRFEDYQVINARD